MLVKGATGSYFRKDLFISTATDHLSSDEIPNWIDSPQQWQANREGVSD